MIRTFLEFSLAEGAADDLVAFFERESILSTAAAQDGCLGAELTISADGRLATVTAKWADAAAYDVWTSRPDRADLSEELNTFLSTEIGAATVGRVHHIALAAEG
ncbi:MAG: antibiotic biosynthesis monooxygenase [Actinomycetota bacterium]